MNLFKRRFTSFSVTDRENDLTAHKAFENIFLAMVRLLLLILLFFVFTCCHQQKEALQNDCCKSRLKKPCLSAGRNFENYSSRKLGKEFQRMKKDADK
ncbi:MAG: hypothetical protein V1904_07330, partial [Bacteroidota bacterium]